MFPDVTLINFSKPFFITTNAVMVTVYCQYYVLLSFPLPFITITNTIIIIIIIISTIITMIIIIVIFVIIIIVIIIIATDIRYFSCY